MREFGVASWDKSKGVELCLLMGEWDLKEHGDYTNDQENGSRKA